MKKLILLTICSMWGIWSYAQSKPREVIKYDTVVNKHVEYAPDTIAVYFKEVTLGNQVYESWNYGYVIWQTMSKIYINNGFTFGDGGGVAFGSDTSYVSNPYAFSQAMPGKFLYMNKKPVPNKVIMAFKR